jgi:hypothetical protein
MALAIPNQPQGKQVLLTLRSDHVEQLDSLVRAGAASNRSELVDKVVGGFLADLRNGQQNQQSQQSALGSLIAFILIVVGMATILKALGGKN